MTRIRGLKVYWLGAACVLLGCSAPAWPGTSDNQDEIVNGEVDTGHPAAVAVVHLFPKTNGKIGVVSCTGAIFSTSGDTGYVLTAAHCLLPSPAAGVPQPIASRLFVVEGEEFRCFLDDQTGSSCPGPVHPVTALASDPEFADGASPPLAAHDLGVMTIGGVRPTTPSLPLLVDAAAAAPGTAVDIVGYGEQAYSDPPLTNTGKRHVTNTLEADFDTPTTVGIYMSTTGIGGTCDGDSGGPWIVDVAGVDHVAAVTSVGHHCDQSAIAARVAAAASGFLAPYLPAGSGGGGAGGASAGGAGGSAGAVSGGSGASNAASTDASSSCAIPHPSRSRAGWGYALVGLALLSGRSRRFSARRVP